MVTLVAVFVLNLQTARAGERTFKCFARNKASVTMMVTGTFEETTTEPTGPVLIAGHAPATDLDELLGSPDDPIVFEPTGLTLDHEAVHREFLARGGRDDGVRFFLSASSVGGHLEFARAGRVNLRFETVSCRFSADQKPDDWSWPGPHAGWPY